MLHHTSFLAETYRRREFPVRSAHIAAKALVLRRAHLPSSSVLPHGVPSREASSLMGSILLARSPQDARLLRAKSRLGHRCHSFWKRRRCRARRLRTSEDCSVAPFAPCNGVTSCMASSPLLECYTYNCPERKAHSVMLLHG
jgi:hypothetical protein